MVFRSLSVSGCDGTMKEFPFTALFPCPTFLFRK
jgi:hypothetical protein